MNLHCGFWLVLAVWTSVIRSQHVQWIQTGWPRLGAGLALVGDLDGDGEEDIVTGVRVPDGSTDGRREIWFLSSRDGSFLPQRIIEPTGDVYNAVAHAGDFDRDGCRDFLLYGRYQSQDGIHAISARTLTRLFRLVPVPGVDWGYSVASDLDIDGDGASDVVLTAPLQGSVYAYDRFGGLMYVVSLRSAGMIWGPGINRFPDLDHDGCDEFVVGLGEQSTAGGAEVVSGRTGQTLVRVVGPTPGDYLGIGVAACGDLDGDGLPDIAAGGGAIGSPGSVQVFSSRTGQRLHAWYTGGYYDGFGFYIEGSVDIDQDGVCDVIAPAVGEPVSPAMPNVYGTVHGYSGRDGTRLMRFTDTTGGSSVIGFSQVLAVPPRAGSAFPRFLVPAWSWGYDISTLPFYRGRMWMFEGGPNGASTVAPPCAGTLAKEPRIGLRPLSSSSSRVTLADADPGVVAFLVLGLAQAAVPFDLSPYGFRGCLLQPDVFEIGVSVAGSAGLDAGYAKHDFARPFTTAATGVPVVGQWLVLGAPSHWPGGTSATLRWTLQ